VSILQGLSNPRYDRQGPAEHRSLLLPIQQVILDDQFDKGEAAPPSSKLSGDIFPERLAQVRAVVAGAPSS
jgi:hypothetical protein